MLEVILCLVVAPAALLTVVVGPGVCLKLLLDSTWNPRPTPEKSEQALAAEAARIHYCRFVPGLHEG